MPAPRAKNYGSGPHGYLQRVLMGGVRPFSHQPQASRLLGRQSVPTAQPLSANQMSSLSFNYPDTHNIQNIKEIKNDMSPHYPKEPIANSNQDKVLLKNSGPDLNDHFQSSMLENDLGDSTLAGKAIADSNTQPRTNTLQNDRDMTVLSWLEHMQSRQPLLVQDEVTQESEAAINTDDIVLTAQESNRSRKKKVLKTDGDYSTLEPLSMQLPPQAIKTVAFKDDKSSALEEVIDSELQSTNIDLPDESRSKKSRMSKKDESLKLTDRTTLPLLKSNKKFRSEQHRNQRSEAYKADSDNSYESQSHVKNKTESKVQNKVQSNAQIKSRNPETRVIARPDAALQGTSMAKLQQALQTRPKSISSSNSEASSSAPREDPPIPQTQRIEPQVHQHVTIINPAVSSNQSSAFWERNYMGRSGPRSYK